MGFVGRPHKAFTIFVFVLLWTFSGDPITLSGEKIDREIIANHWRINKIVYSALEGNRKRSMFYTSIVLFLWFFRSFVIFKFWRNCALGALWYSATLLFRSAANLILFAVITAFPWRSIANQTYSVKKTANRHSPQRPKLNISDKGRIPNLLKLFSPWQVTGIYSFYFCT